MIRSSCEAAASSRWRQQRVAAFAGAVPSKYRPFCNKMIWIKDRGANRGYRYRLAAGLAREW
jgi:hypothetical protein